MDLTFISDFGIRVAHSMADLWEWLTTTTIDSLLSSLSSNGVLGWLTANLLEAMASLLGIFGYETNQPIIDFFFLCTVGILIIWVLDLLRRIIL